MTESEARIATMRQYLARMWWMYRYDITYLDILIEIDREIRKRIIALEQGV